MPGRSEGLIGFKLQAYVNNPKRTQDIEDIRSLLRVNKNSLNMGEVSQYFRSTVACTRSIRGVDFVDGSRRSTVFALARARATDDRRIQVVSGLA